MNILDLGIMPGQSSMLTFHALARQGFEGLVIVSPETPLVSIGYFQDAEKEIDIQNVKKMNIPFMRREVGGGATYLDRNQIFYQVIWNRYNTKFPKDIKEILRFLSQAPIDTYEHFGISTMFRGENDIVTSEGRKIAGEAGGDIENSMVFVGGILTDFDYDTMPKVLKVPSEKFRDKIHKSISEHLTTMKKELGEIPPRQDIVNTLRNSFEKILGPLAATELHPSTLQLMSQLEKRFTSSDFIYKKTPKIPKSIKIKSGLEIYHGTHKAPGGLIRSYHALQDNTIEEADFAGDFQLFPKNSLDHLGSSLKDIQKRPDLIVEKLSETYQSKKIQSPGVKPEDLVTSIQEAK